MKTIAELETELAEAEKLEAEAWEKVKAVREIYDKMTKAWGPLRTRVEVLRFQVETRKEMEAGQ